MEKVGKSVLRETDAEAVALARRLLREARYGSLGVIDPGSGSPMVSRVATATMPDGAPIILVSSLSSHTGALIADARASLLVGEPGKGDPLAHPRMSVACNARRIERGTPACSLAEARYLSRHPKAKLYSSFADFSFFVLDPQSASLNGGFGKAYALTREDLLLADPCLDELAAAEQGAVVHMNEDHADAIALYAHHLGKADGEGWRIAGLDPEGLDLLQGDKPLRIRFPAPLRSAAELRQVLVQMANDARTSSHL